MTRFPRVAVAAILAFAGLWLASSNGLLRAQSTSAPQRQLLFLNEIELSPGAGPDWTELQKSVLDAQKKSTRSRDVWASGPGGGDPRLRAIVTPISNLAQFDNPNPFIQAIGGQQAFTAYQAKNQRLIASSRSTILTTRPDLGFGTRPAKYNVAILTVVNVTNGRAADFESFLKTDIVPALKKGGATYFAVAQVLFGDDANKYMSLLPVNDYAELAKGHPLERALGADGMAKISQKTGPFVSRLERRIIRYLPDLSFGAPGATSH